GSPPQPRRGGCASNKKSRSHRRGADGVVLANRLIFLTSTTPAAATASALPSSAEEGSLWPISCLRSVHGTFFSRRRLFGRGSETHSSSGDAHLPRGSRRRCLRNPTRAQADEDVFSSI